MEQQRSPRWRTTKQRSPRWRTTSQLLRRALGGWLLWVVGFEIGRTTPNKLLRTWGRRLLWVVGIGITLVVLIRLLRIGYTSQWTGFGQSKVNKDIQPAKTLWDWLDLLIVPIVLAIGGYLLNQQQRAREQQIAKEHAQDEALEAYLDQVSQLLTDEKRPLRRAGPGDDLSAVARARTLTVLTRLDGSRKRSVLQFLYESGLIETEKGPVVSLDGADLRRADLAMMDLKGIHLARADLKGCDLGATQLSGANFYDANLSGATLVREVGTPDVLELTDLTGANLSLALLEDADLRGANLAGANLEGAKLDRANLEGANLEAANLSLASWRYANLRQVTCGFDEAVTEDSFFRRALIMTNAQLIQQIFPAEHQDLPMEQEHWRFLLSSRLVPSLLEGATMPNGQKFEDWFKNKEGGEDGENSTPS